MAKKELKGKVTVDSRLYDECPLHAWVNVQIKCKTAKVGVEALASLDPCFFYTTRKQKLATAHKKVKEAKATALRAEFEKQLDANKGAFDVYLRVLYSHSPFTQNFSTTWREYSCSRVAKVRPIVLLDSGWLGDNKIWKEFDKFCGENNTPLLPIEDEATVSALQALLKDKKCKCDDLREALQKLGLCFSGDTDVIRARLEAYLQWQNNTSGHLNINVDITNPYFVNM